MDALPESREGGAGKFAGSLGQARRGSKIATRFASRRRQHWAALFC
jgi:hypothetical protein